MWVMNGEKAAAQRLVIDAGRQTAALRGGPGLAVVIGIGSHAAGAVELGGERAPSRAVREEDRIEAHPRVRRALVRPGGGGRGRQIIESDAEGVVGRLADGLAGLPCDS